MRANRGISRAVRPLAAILLAAAIITANLQTGVVADEIKRPTAAQLEQALRAHLAERQNRRQTWQTAASVLEDLDLKSLERRSPRQWDADLELSFDFGPPPRSLVGFQRRQTGPWFLRVEEVDGGFRVLRFHRAGRMQPLPSPATAG